MSPTFDIINNFVTSWQGVIMLLGAVFIALTARAWGRVIDRLSVYFKRNDFQVSTSHAEQADVLLTEDYAKIQTTLSDLNIHADKEFKDFLNSVKQHLLERNVTKEEVRELIHSIFTIKEQYEFAYLNLFLSLSSKHALSLLDNLGSATKRLFRASMTLPVDMEDQDTQREVIFNALLCHHLIEAEQGVYQVSEKGKRFLEFIGIL